MENAEEIKIKSVKVSLPFDILLKRAIKQKIVDFTDLASLQNLKDEIKKYFALKAAMMWKTRRLYPSDLQTVAIIPGMKPADAKYITISAFNPMRSFDPSSATDVEAFVFSEYVSTLKRLSIRAIRDEAKAERFDILEIKIPEPDMDYSRIGIIRMEEKYLPFGADVSASLWLKK